MAKIQKSLQKQNLENIRVLIDDPDPNSRYFQLREVRDVLHSGRQGFLIAGSPELINTTEVLVEILDSNGDPIFISAIRNFAEGRARFISIEVYEDTPTGPATMTILGEAALDLDGNPVPGQWVGVFNVKFQKTFQVDPLRTNDAKIRVFQTPELRVSEILAPFRKTVTSSISQVNGTGSAAGATALQNVATGVPNIYTVTTPDTPISKSMEGGSFTASIDGVAGSAPGFSGTFSSSITSVLNDRSFELETSLINDAGIRFVPFTNVTNFTISFQDTSVFSTTTLTRSFVDVNLEKLKTFSGDIARAKMFVRSEETTTEFEFLTDIRLEAQELTTTQSANLGPSTKMGSFFAQEVIDEFWTAGTITRSFVPPYVTSSGLLTAEPTRDTTELIDAMHISAPDLGFPTGSNTGPRFYMALTGSGFFGGSGATAPDVTLNFIKGLEYSFVGDLLCLKGIDSFEGKMDIYLSGSAFPSTSSLGTLIGSVNSPVGEIRNLRRGFTTNFIASNDGTAKLIFAIHQGDWHVSEVSIQSAVETGFNPDCAEFIIPIFGKRFEQLQFKAVLFDPNNNEFPKEILSDFVFFDGGNLLLRGTDHRIEGTLKISPSGSGITLTSEGFLATDGTPLSGSAIFMGEGRFFTSGTAFLVAEHPSGNPIISMGDKLKGFVDPTTGDFILQIVGTVLVGSGSSFVDIRSLLPRKPTDEFFHRIRGINLDFFDLQGKKALTAGNVQSDTSANFILSEQIARMGKYTRGTIPRTVPASSPLIVSGITGSFNPFSAPTVTAEISASGTIDVPTGTLIWNNTLYGNMTIDIDEALLLAGQGAYQVDFELTVDTSWVGFESGSNPGIPSEELNLAGTRTVQTITIDDDFFITQTGSFSPDPFISYPIHIPEQRPDGFNTLFVVLKFSITTTQE